MFQLLIREHRKKPSREGGVLNLVVQTPLKISECAQNLVNCLNLLCTTPPSPDVYSAYQKFWLLKFQYQKS